MKYMIKDYELGGKETEVEAPGMAEAMFEYLPWPTLEIEMAVRYVKGVADVTDKQTDFRYEVRAL
jgi:hypothetical protein